MSARTWLAALLIGRQPYTVGPLVAPRVERVSLPKPAPAEDARFATAPVVAPFPALTLPDGLRPVPMAPPGSTHCSRGEICGTRHPLDGEHLVTAQPATDWTRGML